jgi:L-alanine-DL-glutamate epimerase-like enolase superfamily enzyme
VIITDVEALLLRQQADVDETAADGSQDALVVRVHTDEGIVGIGEIDSVPLVAKAIIEVPSSHKIASGIRRLLVGENPLEIDRLWKKMYDGTMYFGRRGAVVHAISGVEIALWDLAGKALGQPIHTLLGGARRSRLKAYASTLWPSTPSETSEVVAELREQGFDAIKLGWGPMGLDPDLDVALVQAAREAGGDDFDLLVDVGCGWTNVRSAIERVRRMEECNPYWVEEPFLPDEYAKYHALADAVDTPIAGGEEETTVWDFERLIERGGVAVVQPDVTRAGGMRECLKIAALAKERGRRTVLHAWSTGIIKAATLHVLAAMEEAELMEYCVQGTELNKQLTVETFPVRDGFVDIPHGPGLGVTLDEDVVERCLVREPLFS